MQVENNMLIAGLNNAIVFPINLLYANAAADAWPVSLKP